MIAVKTISLNNGKAYFEIAGLSTETKPSHFDGYDVADGSMFFEQDTKDFYYRANGGWGELGVEVEIDLSGWTEIAAFNEEEFTNGSEHFYIDDYQVNQMLGEQIVVVQNGNQYVYTGTPVMDTETYFYGGDVLDEKHPVSVTNYKEGNVIYISVEALEAADTTIYVNTPAEAIVIDPIDQGAIL